MRYYVAYGASHAQPHDVVSYLLGILGRKNFRYLSYGALGSLILYLLFPSINSAVASVFGRRSSPRTAKRIDRYTTGLTNVGNFCFANSSIQGLCSLDSLTKYLNEVYKALEDVKGKSAQIDTRVIVHWALTDLLADLQESIFSPRSKSIAPLVKALEVAYRGRMSSNQNDAHEFLQLLLEALQNEYAVLSTIIPEHTFPFEGQMASNIVCLSCRRTSATTVNPFLIYELITPQRPSATISDIISESQSELIEGYSCLYCKVSLILENESRLSSLGVPTAHSAEEEKILNYLRTHHDKLLINEDIPTHIEYYINTYNRNGCQPSRLKSNIARRTVITKPPQALIIHLSRSNFNGMNFSRNPCNVDFQEVLGLQVWNIKGNVLGEATTVKYVLKSVVKHTGTHYQGHYQCYRKKPNFVADISSDPPTFVNQSVTLQQYGGEYPVVSAQPLATLKAKKMRRIKSVTHHPYWHISDTSVKEARVETVLGERKYAYMLFYDLVDS